jgi:hypothetical protein
MDAVVPQDVRHMAYGQAAWSWLPDAGVKFAECFRRRWGLESPVPQGERGAAVKPLRRECRAISALPDDLWAFSFSAHEDCGCG